MGDEIGTYLGRSFVAIIWISLVRKMWLETKVGGRG